MRVLEKKVENRRKTVKNYRKKKLKNARTRVVEKKVENCKNCKKCKKCGKSQNKKRVVEKI